MQLHQREGPGFLYPQCFPYYLTFISEINKPPKVLYDNTRAGIIHSASRKTGISGSDISGY